MNENLWTNLEFQIFCTKSKRILGLIIQALEEHFQTRGHSSFQGPAGTMFQVLTENTFLFISVLLQNDITSMLLYIHLVNVGIYLCPVVTGPVMPSDFHMQY